MLRRFFPLVLVFPVLAAFALAQYAPPPPAPVASAPGAAPADAGAPGAQQGVEVLGRGPIHEAFATPTGDPVPTKPVLKKPPAPLDEMPPEEKPDGNVSWIGGYWAWDDDRKDFLWVSGTWRSAPPGKTWVSGYWKESGDQWQWAPGFWSDAAKDPQRDAAVAPASYLPQPPAMPEVAPPPPPPNVVTTQVFFVPGSWYWNGTVYVWRAGYWARVQPGYVWVPAHYRWTPGGCVFIPGYWDLAVSRRGVLYAPVLVTPGVTVAYTPYYAVRDTLVLETLFIRPAYGCYYFGDYYGPAYRQMGFESCVVYSGRHYDAIFVYERCQRPDWVSVQINLCNDRFAGRAALPPRTLVVNGRIAAGGIAPAAHIVVAGGGRMVRLDTAARRQALAHAAAARERAVERGRAEAAVRKGPVPHQPVGHVPPGRQPLSKQPLRKDREKEREREKP